MLGNCGRRGARHGMRLTWVQADFVRNGNAHQIMKMSASDTTQLWHAVVDNDFPSFNSVKKEHAPSQQLFPQPTTPSYQILSNSSTEGRL